LRRPGQDHYRLRGVIAARLGGTHKPTIVSWPGGVAAASRPRREFQSVSHVSVNALRSLRGRPELRSGGHQCNIADHDSSTDGVVEGASDEEMVLWHRLGCRRFLSVGWM